MPSQRTLNILRFANSQNPEEFSYLLEKCGEAGSSKQLDSVIERLKEFLVSVSPSFVARTDLGDAFQANDNRLEFKARRLSKRMVNDAVHLVKQAVQSGNLNDLKSEIGLSQPAEDLFYVPPSNRERRGLNNAITTLLGRQARLKIDQTSEQPTAVVVLTTDEWPYNSTQSNVEAVQAALVEFLPNLPESHVLRRLPVRVESSRLAIA